MTKPSKPSMERASEIVYGLPRWTDDATLVERIAKALDAELARSAKLVEALEVVKNCIDTDSVKTETDDGEIEYWISHDQVQLICDEALAALKGNK